MDARTLGVSKIEVSALGLGCWAIGGPVSGEDGKPIGFGNVDDSESLRAIRAGIDAGITFFDTADIYGTGASERLLGTALGSDRGKVVLATKFALLETP